MKLTINDLAGYAITMQAHGESEYKKRSTAEVVELKRQADTIPDLIAQIDKFHQIIHEQKQRIAELSQATKSDDKLVERLRVARIAYDKLYQHYNNYISWVKGTTPDGSTHCIRKEGQDAS